MTSVPKPLKFLRAHYAGMKTTFDGMPASENRQAMADVLSVLAMNAAPEGSRESLSFKLQGSAGDVGAWGHEYVRYAPSPSRQSGAPARAWPKLVVC